MGLLGDLKAIEQMIAKNVLDDFGVKVGLSFDEVIAKLDQPLSQKQKGNKIICKWKKIFSNGHNNKFTIIFVDGIVERIK